MWTEQQRIFPRATTVSPRAARAVVLLIFLCALVGSMVTLRELWQSFETPLSFRRDFLQEYLLALAVAKGDAPYQGIALLAERYLGAAVVPRLFPHPSPHPPTAIPFLMPLAVSTYFVAQLSWFLLQLCSFLICLFLLARRFVWSRFEVFAFGLLVFSSRPSYVDLVQGQFGYVLAAVLLAAVTSLESGHRARAGILLGVAFSLKFFALALLPLLILRKEFRVAAFASLCFLGSFALAAYVITPSQIQAYFLQVLPEVRELYAHNAMNISLLTLGTKLRDGATAAVYGAQVVSPLLRDLPALAEVVSWTILGLGFLSFLAALRLPLPLAVFAVMLAHLVFSPISWIHGFVPAFLCYPWLAEFLHGRHRFLQYLFCTGLFFGDAFFTPVADTPAGLDSLLLAFLPSLLLLLILAAVLAVPFNKGEKGE